MLLVALCACCFDRISCLLFQVFNDAIQIEKYVEKKLKKVTGRLVDSMLGVTKGKRKKAKKEQKD